MIKVVLTVFLFSSLLNAETISKIEFHSVVAKNKSKNIYINDIAKFKNVDVKIATKLKNIVVDEYPKENKKKS